MRSFVVSLVARMLPSGTLLDDDGITFIANGLGAIWDNKDISDTLMSGDPGGAAVKLVQFIGSDKFINTFVSLANQYGRTKQLSMLTKWTSKGVQKVLVAVAATDVIVSSTDFIANYFANNQSKVLFQWKTAPRMTPGVVWHPSDAARAQLHACSTSTFGEADQACVMAVMRNNGASQEAISFTASQSGKLIATEFTAATPVAVVRVECMVPWGTYYNCGYGGYFIVNGSPAVIQADWMTSGDLDPQLSSNSQYAALVTAHPNTAPILGIRFDGFDQYEGLQPASSGFAVVIRSPVKECHVCDQVLGNIHVAYKFDGSGRYLGRSVDTVSIGGQSSRPSTPPNSGSGPSGSPGGLSITGILPDQGAASPYLPTQFVTITFDRTVTSDGLVYTVSPATQTNVRQGRTPNELRLDALDQWRQGLTTILILPATTAVDGSSLRTAVTYSLKTAFPTGGE